MILDILVFLVNIKKNLFVACFETYNFFSSQEGDF